jgi:hypothetical protein
LPDLTECSPARHNSLSSRRSWVRRKASRSPGDRA